MSSPLDNLVLPDPKTDLTPLPAGANRNKYITAEDVNDLRAAIQAIQTAFSSGVDPGLFGSGSDGALHFDGAATVLGIVPSGSTYTLTRDIYATTITIDTGITVIPNQFRIYATVSIALAGKINGNGNAGQAGDAGGAGGAEDAAVSTLPKNSAGGGGSTANGGDGADGGTVPRRYAGLGGAHGTFPNGAGAAGGVGAGGGAGSSTAHLGGAGGKAGTAVNTTAQGDNEVAILSILGAAFSVQSGFTAFNGRTGGGGGGGGGDGANKGGGGGASGHYVVVCAPVFTGAGSITSKGGDGAPGSVGNACTGGGGGGGGYVVLVYARGTQPTIDVSGGAGGVHGISGGASGAGGAGVAIVYRVGF